MREDDADRLRLDLQRRLTGAERLHLAFEMSDLARSESCQRNRYGRFECAVLPCTLAAQAL